MCRVRKVLIPSCSSDDITTFSHSSCPMEAATTKNTDNSEGEASNVVTEPRGPFKFRKQIIILVVKLHQAIVDARCAAQMNGWAEDEGIECLNCLIYAYVSLALRPERNIRSGILVGCVCRDSLHGGSGADRWHGEGASMVTTLPLWICGHVDSYKVRGLNILLCNLWRSISQRKDMSGLS